MEITLRFEAIRDLLGLEKLDLPKYTSILLNVANRYGQGTRPRVVGQMSDLIQEFPGRTLQEWQNWYSHRHPNALEEATDKIWQMLGNLKEAMGKIDQDMVRRWAEDLVIVQTFVGLRFQEAILKEVAEARGTDYRLARPDEEAKGIDGYIGGNPVSIKPATYKTMEVLPEEIECEVIYYEKKKNAIVIDFQPMS